MNKKIYQILSVIVLIALTLGSYSSAGASSATAPQLAATTFYVATNGNDASAGTSAAPFKTIQKCITVSQDGNTCSVQPGTYSERLNVNKAITVICVSARKCIIKGATLASNAIVDGFYSLNSDTNDGAITGSGSNYKIINNKVEGSCMVGIKLNGSNGLAENNEVLKSRQCSGSSGPDADGFRFFGNNHIMRGNYIHDINFSDSFGSPHIDCFQTWSGASDTLIENNICDNYDAKVGENNGTSGANLENDVRTTLRRNYFHVYGKGILFESSSSGGKADNNIFVSGPKISGTTGGQYCLFGNSSVTGNVCYLYASGEVLVGGASGSGNVTTNPQMSGYCSLAFPSKGILCGGVAPTTAPPTVAATTSVPNASPIPASATPTAIIVASPTPTKTAAPPSATPTTVVVLPSATLVLPTSTVLVQPSATRVPATTTASAVPVQPTATRIPATATASAVPVQPTSTSVPPTAIVQQPAQPASGTLYDDKHSSFVYSADWRNVALAQSTAGSFKKTSEDGSTITFTFTGQSFSVLYTSGKAYGQVKVYVDGVLVGTIDEYGSKTVYKKRWDYPKQLAPGQHILKLVTVGNLDRKSSLDAVIVR